MTKLADRPKCKCGTALTNVPYVKKDKSRGECTCCSRCDAMSEWPRGKAA
jgi:hypothetical protein